MIRLIFLFALAVTVYLVAKWAFSIIPSNQCSDCKGQGYWIGTRGDKNTCRVCGGTGHL